MVDSYCAIEPVQLETKMWVIDARMQRAIESRCFTDFSSIWFLEQRWFSGLRNN